MLAEIYKKTIQRIQDKIYDYKTIRLEPSVWVEQNIYMTGAESNYPGFLKYSRSPWTREIIDALSPNSGYEMVVGMKNNQSGFTSTVLIPYICYTISEFPANMMFVSGTEDLAKDTVRDKLDPVIQNSGLSHLIRSSDTRRRNKRTGNTDSKKEFAGGTLNIGSYKPSNLRMHSVKIILADEFDDAVTSDRKEGNIRTLLENRTTAFPGTKKILYLSTPTIQGGSNIEKVFDLTDKRHWHWKCPHCKEMIDVLWSVEREDGTFGGIKYELDERNELIESSIHYECQKCKGKILEKDKQRLNASGVWIPTCKPQRPEYIGFQPNAIFTFDTWRELVFKWLEANPPGQPSDPDALKAFVNTKLAQTWFEKGTAPKVSELMSNTRSYSVGVVPDETCKNDGNGKIVLITLACDLGGVMETHNEDVRLDWEIIGHSSNGQTYHINHGSIGTFKRSRKKKRSELENESERDKWTYAHGMKFSVWPELKKIIDSNLIGQSGDAYKIDITVIDTGHFTRLAYEFINEENNPFILGVKGYAEDEYRKLTKDTPIISRSREMVGRLYILQVNQLKDILAANMAKKIGMDGYQPAGFMNFPQPELGKYNMRNYFTHFEGEHRVDIKKGDMIVGFAWKKKNASVENHYFDTTVYNLAAREIYIDVLRRSSSKYSKITFEDFVTLMG